MACVHEFHGVSQQQNHVCINCGEISTVQNYTVDDARFEICIRQTFTANVDRFYERKNHFSSLIYQLLGISNLNLPEEVIELGKEVKTVTELRKKLKEHKFSQHIPSAARILENSHPQKFLCTQSTRQIIQRLLRMFCYVERAWVKLQPKLAPRRKSFLNYNFVLKKLCERIHEGDMCRDLKQLKSPHVKKQMEIYWKAIEVFLNWEPMEKLKIQKFPVVALLPNKWNPCVHDGKFVKKRCREHQTHESWRKKPRCT